MPTRKNIPHHSGVYFITFTNYKWLPLFEITNAYELVYKWFNYLREKGNYIIGYVIMPNHLHTIIAFRKSKQSINTIIGNGKRFLAYEIVKKLKENHQNTILETLEKGVKSTDKNRGKLHEVFEESFDWKESTSDKFIQQKLDYIHNNPCTDKSKLSINPSDYKHSSAKYYLDNVTNEYVTNYMELHDINLEQTYAESLAGDSAVKCNTVQTVNTTTNSSSDFPAESPVEYSASNKINHKSKSDFPVESLSEDSASTKAQNKFYAESLAGDSVVKCNTVQTVNTTTNSAKDFPVESLVEYSASNKINHKSKSDFSAESLAEDSASTKAQNKFYAESLAGESAVKCNTVQTVNTTTNSSSDFPAESPVEYSASNKINHKSKSDFPVESLSEDSASTKAQNKFYAESLEGDFAVKCDTVQTVNTTTNSSSDFPAESPVEYSASNKINHKSKSDFPAESLAEDSASTKAQNKFYAESLVGDSAVKCVTVQTVNTTTNSAKDFPAESLVEYSAQTIINHKSKFINLK